MIENKYDIVKFVDGSFELDVRVSPNDETVWLTQEEIAKLFNVDRTRIVRHINNIYNEAELDETSTCAKNAQVQIEGDREVLRTIRLYNLDMIISIGYRVRSNRGIEFRRWANKILKQYIFDGYALNQKRLEALNRTVAIQNRIIANVLEIDEKELSLVISNYTNALYLLDNYDHQSLIKPKGNKSIFVLEYNECRKLIDEMEYNEKSNVFGVEKEIGKLDGILKAIYQTAWGDEIYPSTEEKACNLLYFLIKDHPFVDGCKRIAATLFLHFLYKNNILINNGRLLLSNSALVAITLLIAESKPEEKEIMIALLMNMLQLSF